MTDTDKDSTQIEEVAEKKADPITVNGEEVGEALIGQELQMLRERYAQEMTYVEMEAKKEQIESDARENAVERVLLMQKAREEIVSVRPEEIEARYSALQEQHGGEATFKERFELKPEDEQQIKADIEDGVRLEKYFDTVCKDAPRPTEEESRAYYDEHKEEFKMPEMVHAAHIVQHPSNECPMEKVYADLMNVRERLLAGEDFDTLATEKSHCQDGGYDLGYFARGQMVQSFEDMAFRTPVGEISDVFQTEFGYHILKVLDHKDECYREFKDVRYDIEGMLYEQSKNELIGEVVDKLRETAKIVNLNVYQPEL